MTPPRKSPTSNIARAIAAKGGEVSKPEFIAERIRQGLSHSGANAAGFGTRAPYFEADPSKGTVRLTDHGRRRIEE